MRAAPPVDYPVARRGLSDGAGSMLAALAVLVPLVWAVWQLHTARKLALPDSMGGLLAGVLAALLAAALHWRAAGRRESRRLRWDGTRWQLLAGAREAEELLAPDVRIDLGFTLLLRARSATGGMPLNLALEQRDAPEAWHALRVAIANLPTRRAVSPAHPGPGVAT